jgi:hypothetical protein
MLIFITNATMNFWGKWFSVTLGWHYACRQLLSAVSAHLAPVAPGICCSHTFCVATSFLRGPFLKIKLTLLRLFFLSKLQRTKVVGTLSSLAVAPFFCFLFCFWGTNTLFPCLPIGDMVLLRIFFQV